MVTWRVKTLPERQQTETKKWQVLKSGSRVGTADTKNHAMDIVRKRQKKGDKVVIENMNGRVLRRTVTGTEGSSKKGQRRSRGLNLFDL